MKYNSCLYDSSNPPQHHNVSTITMGLATGQMQPHQRWGRNLKNGYSGDGSVPVMRQPNRGAHKYSSR